MDMYFFIKSFERNVSIKFQYINYLEDVFIVIKKYTLLSMNYQWKKNF